MEKLLAVRNAAIGHSGTRKLSKFRKTIKRFEFHDPQNPDETFGNIIIFTKLRFLKVLRILIPMPITMMINTNTQQNQYQPMPIPPTPHRIRNPISLNDLDIIVKFTLSYTISRRMHSNT